MTPFSSSSSSGRGTSMGMTSVDSFCTPTIPSSPVQRSLPVPPRLGKKSRPHAQSLHLASNAADPRSTELVKATTLSDPDAYQPTSPLVGCAELSTLVNRSISRGALAALPCNTPPSTIASLAADDESSRRTKAADGHEHALDDLKRFSFENCGGLDKENDLNRTPVRNSLRHSFSIDPSTPSQQTLTNSSSANSFGVRRRTPDRRSSVVRATPRNGMAARLSVV
jgi:hypothetical protein